MTIPFDGKSAKVDHHIGVFLTASPSSEPLAILGGKPLFEAMVTVGRPNMPARDAFLNRVGAAFDNVQLTNYGPMVREFESAVAKRMAVRNCVAMCNGTLALELSMSVLGLTGEVIVPSYTFVATAHAVLRQGLKPVFVDVDPRSHTLDPAKVRDAISDKTSAILAVSLWGNYDGEEALRKIADDHDLALIYDSAHSFGCARENGTQSQLCDMEALSFHATKSIHAVEGGAVLTNDDVLADKLRLLTNFGFDGEDSVVHMGTNAKMNELEAAMGLSVLDEADEIFAKNRANYLAYQEGLASIPGLHLMEREPEKLHNFQYIVVEVDPVSAGLSRDEIVAALRQENVLARRYFHPGCHRMAPYSDLFPDVGAMLPVTEALSENVMVLPNGTAIDPASVTHICDRLGGMVAQADSVKEALNAADPTDLPDFMRPK